MTCSQNLSMLDLKSSQAASLLVLFCMKGIGGIMGMTGSTGSTGMVGMLGIMGIIPWNMGIKLLGAVFFLVVLLILKTPSINGSTYLR